MSKSKLLHVNVLAGRILDAILLQGPSGVLLELLLIHRPNALSKPRFWNMVVVDHKQHAADDADCIVMHILVCPRMSVCLPGWLSVCL